MEQGIVFELHGVRNWLRRLNNLDKKLANKIKRQGCRVAANVVLPECKKRMPRRSGALAKAIKVRSAKMKRRGSIGIMVVIGGQNWNKQDTFYGGFLEFGVKPRKKDGTKRRHRASSHNPDGTWRIRPQHNILAAWLAKKKAAQRAALQFYKREIENPANMR